MKRSGKVNGMVLAVYVGPGRLSDAARDLVDMMRYDRCYPVNLQPNSNSLGELGWLLFYQPPQPGLTPGFKTDRWRSFGYHETFSAPRYPESGSDMFSDDQLQVLRSKGRELLGSRA